jgi:hypothetical protein
VGNDLGVYESLPFGCGFKGLRDLLANSIAGIVPGGGVAAAWPNGDFGTEPLSALPLPDAFLSIDLIEVRRWHQPRLLGRQVCQSLDIGDGIGKREPISAPHLQRPQHF